MTFLNEVSFTAAVMLTINEIFKQKPEVKKLGKLGEATRDDDEEEHFMDKDKENEKKKPEISKI